MKTPYWQAKTVGMQVILEGLAPGSVHTFRGLIMPGIVRAGLVSDRLRPGYEEANIRVFSDTAVLERLEDLGESAFAS